jgi:hypothetical protein
MLQVDDLDYQIMINLSFDDLISLCETTIYSTNICENKQFWIKKIYHDNLVTPNAVLFDTISGMMCYYYCDIITKYLNTPMFTKRFTHYKSLSKENNNILLLILKYTAINIGSSPLGVIVVIEVSPKTFQIKLKTKNGIQTPTLTRQDFINFLFEGLNNKSISINL